MLSFLRGLAQGTLGVPLTSSYIGKWSSAAYTLYTFRSGQDYFMDLINLWSGGTRRPWKRCGEMAVAMMLLKCCLYYHCRQVPTAQETAEDLLEVPSDVIVARMGLSVGT